ncbi:permease [Arcanobacterium hippocoleae]
MSLMIKNPVLARLRAAHQFWVLVLLSAAAVMLVALTAITGPVWKMPGTLESWAAITIAIVFQALPFLVLGILVSAVISAIVPEDLLRRFTPRNEVAAVPVVCSTGLLLPGCECASVPVSNALMRRGIPRLLHWRSCWLVRLLTR